MSTITKKQIVDMVAENTTLSKKDVKMIIEKFCDKVEESLAAGNKVQLQGFGTFEVRDSQERIGRNPRNPEETIVIPACKRPVFKFSSSVKERMNA